MSISDFVCTYIRLPDSRATSEIKADIRDELEFHLAMMEEANLRSGKAPEEAKNLAINGFGDFQKVEAECQRIQLGERHALQRIQTFGVIALIFGLAAMAWQSTVVDSQRNAAVAKLTQTVQDLQTQLVTVADAAAPTLLEVFPKNGATDVDPNVSEIRATFSKPMLNKSWSWCETERPFPVINGEIHYMNDMKTCVLPVSLTPNTEYALTLNSRTNRNFKDENGRTLEPVEIVFKTASAKAATRR